MTVAVLTSGGDAPGMNSAVRAVVFLAASRGVPVVGVERGYQGLLDRRFRPLTREVAGGLAPLPEVSVHGNLGGSMLGSARCKPFYTPEGRAQAAKNIADFDGLVGIGGNGSLAGAHARAKEHGVRLVGVPASIDHDIGCTNTAIGVDSALNTIVGACDRISDTARAHRRAFVVEVMGRRSGYLCMAAAVATAADAALFREAGRSEDELVENLANLVRRSFSGDREKQRVLILKAEGVEVPCTRLVRRVQEHIGDELEAMGASIRATVLGHLVRGGPPTYQDRAVGGRFGAVALTSLLAGKTDVMTAWSPPVAGGEATVDRHVELFGLGEVLDETERLLDGSSPVTQARVKAMARMAGVLAL